MLASPNRPILSILFFVYLSLGPVQAQELAPVLYLASQEEAQSLLAQEDDFIEALSPFDVQARLQDPSARKEDLIEYIPSQARAFKAEEAKSVLEAALRIDALMAERNWQLPYPDTVYVLKTSGEEEGGAAGYTRGKFIVLNEKAFANSFDDLVNLLAHEVFHILGRHDAKLRADLYRLIGFEIVAPIQLGTVSRQRLTNPDATQLDAVIELSNREGKRFRALMLTYSPKDYQGGSFFEYLQVGFLPLDENNAPLYKNEKAIIYGLKDVAASFFTQVGRNTNYIIHPEEILAENFRMALVDAEVSNEALLNSIDTILKNHKP